MSYLDVIADLKQDCERSAKEHSIPVYDSERRILGKLLPVGAWILEAPDVIESLMQWRKRFMRFFLSRFEPSLESMTGYLHDLSIGEPGRLLFLIYDEKDEIIGHIGISNVDGQKGELDNMVRGVSGGHPQLMYYAEYTILSWAFDTLALDSIDLRVLSYNHPTVSLHHRLGFKTIRQVKLLREEKNGITTHNEVEPDKANVDYSSLHMGLTKPDFDHCQLD